MKLPDIPLNESERIHALEEYQILDTLPEKEFDNITCIASQICETPVSLISLIDSKRQWFKSHHGSLATETPRDVAFCAHAINRAHEIFIIPDSRNDERFLDNPLVLGEPHVIFYAGVPLVSPDGFVLGTLCVTDETPRQLSSEQLQSLKSLAEQTISLFELRKANLELAKAKQILENRNKELNQFAYIVSHDLKSPLANIIASAELFYSEYKNKMDPEGLKLQSYIKTSAQKLKALIDGILAYYRGDQLLPSKLQTINFPEFLQSIIELVSLPKNDCKISFPKEKNSIKVNSSALEQIFLNLISNAIKYNNKEHIIIDITFKQDERFYYFTVTDNGIGIRSESIEKIFELFKILDIQDRFGDYGTGIGLATVKKLVENNGGAISVQSVINESTTFWFSLRKG